VDLATVIRDERFTFADLRQVVAMANEEKSGDALAGLAATTERQRVAAKLVLAELTLQEIVDHPLIDPDADEVSRLILERLDRQAFDSFRGLRVGQFREWILDDDTDGDDLAVARPGITPEISAAVAKLMSNKDLVLAASKIRVVTRCRNTMGERGVLGIRIQPNHPSDDLEGILLSTADGLLYGCGDAVIGVNPAAECVEVVGSILRGLDRLITAFEIPTQACCLAHITTQLACLDQQVPVDLLFQSIAGTQAANRSFGIDLAPEEAPPAPRIRSRDDEDRRGMTEFPGRDDAIREDIGRLHALGYAQELARRLSGFSNFAISLSIICILAGGVTSFHLGLYSVGGASIGLGWPLVALFSLVVAATMGQLASTFPPTAGGLYHWSSILGGRGWGWATAWFNLAGLVTVLAAINVGIYRFALGAFGPPAGSLSPWSDYLLQTACVVAITASQAAINHLGIGITARLTDFSGYWIILVASLLTVCLLAFAPSLDATRLVTFGNFSGTAGGGTWPRSERLLLLFALGALLPAYTITGFDASAHASEETVAAARSVPRGIVRSVIVSGIAGWVFLSAVVLPQRHRSRRARRRRIPLDHEPGDSRAPGHESHRGYRRGPVPLRPGHGDLGLEDVLRIRP